MMIQMTKWAFRNKAAMILLIILSLGIGTYSYLMLPMEFLPEADNPQITITAIGQGQDAKVMEEKVTAPIEQAVSAVKGKSAILSTSGDGFAKVDINFDSKTNMKEATAEVKDAISQLSFPPGVSKPFVVQFNTSMIPISQISIGFEDGLTPANMQTAEKQILGDLQKVKGVASVSLGGRTSPEIQIQPNLDKLGQYGLTIQDILSILQGRNMSSSIGEQTIDGTSANIKVISVLDSLDDLRNLALTPTVKLGDIAAITEVKNHDSIARVNGKEALYAVVTKEAKANAVSVGKEVDQTVERLNASLPGADINVVYSTSESVESSVNSMLREVLLGALFATIIILLFLRNIRVTLITIVSIPLSLAITLYLLDISGITLNVITLGGVAVAVGRLVDDSIVVIENIYRRMQHEKFSVEMILAGTREVSGAITASTLSTVAVFLPMGLLRGSLQDFLLPFALTVTYSLLTSLIVAMTVVPVLTSLLLRNKTIREHQPAARFAKFLRWNLQHKWIPLTLAVFVFFGSIAIYITMPKGAIDSSDATFLSASLVYPSDMPVDEVIEQGKKLEAFMIGQEEAKFILMQSGNSADNAQWGAVVSPTRVDYSIVMKPGADAEVFMEKLKQQRASYPEAELTSGSMDFMGGSSTTITLDVVGDDVADLTKAADLIMAHIRSIDGVSKAESNQEETKTVYSFHVDPAIANGEQIAMQLQGLLNPIPMGMIRLGEQEAFVYMGAMATPQNEQDLSGLTVMGQNGPVPITSVAQLVKTDEYTTIYHKDGKQYVRVTASVEPSQLSIVGKDIQKATDALTLPDGVDLLIGGASAEQASDFADLGVTAVLSIVIVYLIMVMTFKTLRAPLAIMCSLPLAAIGAVLGLVISGVTPDFTAMFGALMLIGIVVTNAIVLVDRVKQNESHMSIREALIEAASVRMRPIFMTATATICAMLPLIFGHTEAGNIVSQSLAIVVIGGLAVATMLTLVIVPCVYELFYFRKSRKQRLTA